MRFAFRSDFAGFTAFASVALVASTAFAAPPARVAVDPPASAPPVEATPDPFASADSPPAPASTSVVAAPVIGAYGSEHERALSQSIAADATPRATASPLEPSSRYRFYGWQVMAVEGAGATVVGLVGLTGATKTGGGGSDDGLALAATAGLVVYAGGGFVVHLVHDNVGKAFGSLGFTIGLPLTGLAIGAGADAASCSPDPGDDCAEDGMIWGAIAGVLAAPLVDGLVLGWEKKHGAVRDVPVGFLVPYAAPTAGGAVVGVSGAF